MKLWTKISLFSLLGFSVGFSVLYLILENKASATSASSSKTTSDKPSDADWGLLREMDLSSGKASPNLKKLSGAMVRIPGFMIPLEDNQQSVSEFLLVPSPMSCVHVAAPPANQMIHVKMATGRKATMSYGPIWAQGRFNISEHEGPYGKTSYEMIAESTTPYSN